MIRRILYLLLATVILGGLAGAIAFYAFDFKPKMLAEIILGSPMPPQTVSAEEARADSWQPQIAAIGTVTPTEGIDVSPEVGGVVKEINFESGQDVKKGQLLVKLDIATEEADMRALVAQLVNAESELSRKEALANKGLSPRAELDALRSVRDRLQANLERTRAVVAQKFIYAPWDGRVGLREISIGSYLAPGQKIVWLQKIDPIFVDFQIMESEFRRIKDGLKVMASFSAYPDEGFAGEIVTTDARMADTSRMITVRARFDNPANRLIPGMYANVLVDSGVPEQVLTVPQTAVTFSLYGDSVFVVNKAMAKDEKGEEKEELTIERRFVKAGPLRDGRIQIVSGLKPGDKVVTAGHNKIDQGSKVIVDNSIALKAPDASVIQ